MGFGGPVWHASGRGATEALSWALADRALDGVGDPQLGEWRERGDGGVVHVRRRLAAGEADHLTVRDIRGTPEERMRFRQLLRDAPQLRRFVEASRRA